MKVSLGGYEGVDCRGMSPGPWKFHKSIDGVAHAIVDDSGRIIGSNVQIDDGPLMAAAPAMLSILMSLARRSDDLGDQMQKELVAMGYPFYEYERPAG
jgi:hypothetical protein